ncbi:MAG: hypothetical protein EPN93_19950 [Spirochaetes bacterium]|nr:MAG: hypothetical protein EPN93_19950 [Spirochaetota bacterium]
MKKISLVVLAGLVAFSIIGCGPSQGQAELEKLYKDSNTKIADATEALKAAKTADEAVKALETGFAALQDMAKKEEAILKQYPSTRESESLKKLQADVTKISEAFTAEFMPLMNKFMGDKKVMDAMDKLSKVK